MSLKSNKRIIGRVVKIICWIGPMAAMFSEEPIKILICCGYTYITAKMLGFVGTQKVIGSDIDELSF